MKQKKQVAVLVALLVIAGAIWFWYFERDRTALTDPADSPAKTAQLLSVENPAIHWHILEGARKTEYKSSGRNIFTTAAPPPASQVPKKDPHPVCCPLPALPAPPAPDPDPVLPPNIKFFGYGTVPNGASRRAFFTDGQDVYVVAEGEVLLNRYRILRVGNATLEFEEVTSGRKGRAVLEEQAGPSA